MREIDRFYNLPEVKADLIKVLQSAPWEAYSVRQAVKDGKIDGSTYYGSECCCIKGIIAKNVGLPLYTGFDRGILNQHYGILSDVNSPMEAFLYNIRPGDNPENSAYSRFILGCLDDFIAQEETKKAAQVTASVSAGLEEILATALPTEEEEVVPELVRV